MINQDHSEVLRLFQPATPVIATLPRIRISDFFDFSEGFPIKTIDEDRQYFTDAAQNAIEQKQKTKVMADLKKIQKKSEKIKPPKSVSEVQKLATEFKTEDYIDILSAYILFLLYKRYNSNIKKILSDDIFKKLTVHLTNLFEDESSRMLGRLCWAFYLSSQKRLLQSHLNRIFLVDPLLSCESLSACLIPAVQPGKGEPTTSKIKTERNQQLLLTHNLRKLERLISEARNEVSHDVEVLRKAYKDNAFAESIIKKEAKNLSADGKSKEMVAVKSQHSQPKNVINQVMPMMISFTKTAKKGNYDKITDLILILFNWLFPLYLYKKLSRWNEDYTAKAKDKDIAFFSNSVAQAQKDLKSMDIGIAFVKKTDDRIEANQVQKTFQVHQKDNLLVIDILVKAEGMVTVFNTDEIYSVAGVNDIIKRIWKLINSLSQEVAKKCIALTTQSEVPQFINEYSINEYLQRSFPSIAMGIGELAILKKKWIGWNYGGIAKIVNRLPGSEMTSYNEHVKQTSTRTFTEGKEASDRYSERVDKTSKEINKAVAKTIDKEISLQAGITASYTMGYTSIQANAQFAFRQAQSESTNETRRIAKEIVTKATEQLHTEKTEQIELKIDEMIKRTDQAILKSGTDNSFAIAYVNDVFEFELIRWDKRLVLELYIPEPAIGFIEQYIANKKEPAKPIPFIGTAEDILEEDWLCLQSRYPEIQLPQPPDSIKTVDFKAKTEVVEEQDAWGEDIIEGQVEVPLFYYPDRVNVSINVQGDTNIQTEWAVSIAGQKLVEEGKNVLTGALVDKTYDYHRILTPTNTLFSQDDDIDLGGSGTSIPLIPISVKFRNHHDKCAYVNMLFYFRRSEKALEQWKADVFSAIKGADEQRMIEYQDQLRALAESVAVDTDQIVSEDQVKSELKGWFNKALYGKPIHLPLLERNGLQDDAIEPAFKNEDDYLEFFRFDECFDWRNIRYIPLDKKYGSRDLYEFKNKVKSQDYFLDCFVKAGAARVSIPVIPGNELWVLNFIKLRQNNSTLEPSAMIAQAREESSVEDYGSLFQEFNVLADILTHAPGNDDFADGVGKLVATQNTNTIELDLSDNLFTSMGVNLWVPSSEDCGRNLLIEGNIYTIISVDDECLIELDRDWTGPSGSYSYLISGQRIGKSWKVAVPSGEVKLLTQQEFADLQRD